LPLYFASTARSSSARLNLAHERDGGVVILLALRECALAFVVIKLAGRVRANGNRRGRGFYLLRAQAQGFGDFADALADFQLADRVRCARGEGFALLQKRLAFARELQPREV
jgi:hypothetical protein